MMKLETLRVFPSQHFLCQWFACLLLFRIARQCCQIFRSDEKRSGRAGFFLPLLPNAAFFSLSILLSLSVSLSILLISASLLFRQKLARDAKFRDFIDRKVPLARSFRRIFKKIALSVPARFIRIWNSLRTFRTRTGNEQEADLTSKIHL